MYISFDLWMSIGGVDTFDLVINHLNDSWIFVHVIIGSLEVHDTTWVSMARQLESLLGKYDLTHCVIVFVKNEGNNLTSMVMTLHFVVDCQQLKLQTIYEGICFSHIMFKACQYVTYDEKMINDLKHVSVKVPKVVFKK